MPLLTLTGVRKRFGGVQALKGVSFALEPSRVHALVGENGGGRSTLIKILSGVYAPDEGDMRLDGESVRFISPRQAQAAGITTIHQEMSLFPDLSVLENLFMGRQSLRGGRIDWRTMRAQAEPVFRWLGLSLPLNEWLSDLGKARGQLVEIVRAITQAAHILTLEASAWSTARPIWRKFSRSPDRCRSCATARQSPGATSKTTT